MCPGYGFFEMATCYCAWEAGISIDMGEGMTCAIFFSWTVSSIVSAGSREAMMASNADRKAVIVKQPEDYCYHHRLYRSAIVLFLSNY